MNTYRTYLLFIRRWLVLVLLVSFAAGALAYGVVNRSGVTYKVHVSLLVSLANREEPGEYTFDGLYALQATELFTATLSGWTQTPEVIVEAYEEAKVPVPVADARRLRRSVIAQKTAPQLVEIVVAGSNREETERVAAALVAVTSRNVETYHREGVPALEFRVVASRPWTSVTQPATSVIAVGVFVVTFILLINILLLGKSAIDAGSH